VRANGISRATPCAHSFYLELVVYYRKVIPCTQLRQYLPYASMLDSSHVTALGAYCVMVVAGERPGDFVATLPFYDMAFDDAHTL
jgi:hypothetical protein